MPVLTASKRRLSPLFLAKVRALFIDYDLPRSAALGLLSQSIKWPVPLISFPCRDKRRAYRINKELTRLLARLNSALLLSYLELLNHNQQLRLNLLNSALRDVFY
jgi:hypothetical protein